MPEGPLEELVVAEEVSGLLTQYACCLCHSTRLLLAEVLLLVAATPQALVSVVKRQVWVQVSVALDDWQASTVHRLDHRAAKACPW